MKEGVKPLPRLEEVRERIDQVDQRLLELLSERAHLAHTVGKIKRAKEGEGSIQFYRPEREAQVLRRVQELNPGPLSDASIAWLFREIMSACLALEQPIRVAYLGPAGTFSQMAALRQFGHAATLVPCHSIPEVFRAVASGNAAYGVAPVENSTEGGVAQTQEALLAYDLSICGELALRVHHQLLCKSSALTEVRRVYGHAQALGQCRRWLDEHLPQAKRVPVSSNGEGARLAAAKEGAAAIAPELAAELYQLPILAANIEDEAHNTTRFVVLGTSDAEPSGEDKTSLAVSTANQPGALYRLLKPLAERGISLTRIESRPVRARAWEYLFFIDLEGHRREPRVAEALRELEQHAVWLRVFGSYPKAVLSA
ncbi:MAG: prephenate dehydratase [Gammaproteobacteria bacterium]|nr:prephenate dehydratase [Gammaproteobacteria bacterium]